MANTFKTLGYLFIILSLAFYVGTFAYFPQDVSWEENSDNMEWLLLYFLKVELIFGLLLFVFTFGNATGAAPLYINTKETEKKAPLLDEREIILNQEKNIDNRVHFNLYIANFNLVGIGFIWGAWYFLGSYFTIIICLLYAIIGIALGVIIISTTTKESTN